jgi:hypothetical protein
MRETEGIKIQSERFHSERFHMLIGLMEGRDHTPQQTTARPLKGSKGLDSAPQRIRQDLKESKFKALPASRAPKNRNGIFTQKFSLCDSCGILTGKFVLKQ